MFDRLYSITRAYFGHRFQKQANKSDCTTDDFNSFKNSSSDYTSDNTRSSYSETSTNQTDSAPFGIPAQVHEDLALFGISPPGSLDEVIKARNREMKKYHPDKFNSKNEKIDAANEIAQIYNAAFERLKVYYS